MKKPDGLMIQEFWGKKWISSNFWRNFANIDNASFYFSLIASVVIVTGDRDS